MDIKATINQSNLKIFVKFAFMFQKCQKKPQLSDRFDVKSVFEIFDTFFLFYRNETDCNNEIVIKVK